MDRYLDIRILPDPEFPTSQLMNALFAKLHRCLAKLGSEDLGVSFPEVDEERPTLGPVLRLHGSEAAFSTLLAQPWLVGMRDHIQLSAVSPVPAQVKYRRVRRVQAKSNPDRIRRRQMKRHGWTEDEARRRIPDTIRETLSLPYLSLESRSTGHRFHIFLRHEPAEAPSPGPFNAYGLSNIATVPWF